MAQQFHTLRVKDVEKTTADCTLVHFEVPEPLQETFAFRQGQHLTLRTTLNGEDVRRSYSLCSSPLDKEWKVAVKKIEGGVFSGFVNDTLRAGDALEVMHPHGNFYVEPDPEAETQYVAFAAGSGITPIFSILKTHLALEPKAQFSLFYTNQNVHSIILKEEIEALKNQYLDRFSPYFFLTQEDRDVSLFNGRMDEEKMAQIGQYLVDFPSVDHYFLCGPEDMIFMIRDFLKANGVAESKIHFELFTTAAGQKRARAPKTVAAHPNQVQVVLKEGGKSTRFSMAKDTESILEAALRHNSGLPFACKGGVCCTCKAKLLEGQVEMEVNYALEKEQVEAGYILTCQALPLTDTIVVDFDQ